MGKVLALAMNPSLDVESRIEKVVPDKKLRCSKTTAHPGGGGINVARALTRLGVDVTALFPTGGYQGEHHLKLLERENVPVHPIRIDAELRINTHILEAKTNQLFRFSTEGFEVPMHTQNEILDVIRNKIGEYDICVSSGSLPPGVPADFNAQLAEIVQSANKPLVVDTKGAELMKALEHPLHFIKPNLREFEVLANRIIDKNDLEAELEKFRKQGNVENILLTLGGKGAIYCGKEGTFRAEAPKVDKVSAVGAGDSSMAGLIAALMQGHSHKEAVRWAMAAGASAIKTLGTELMQQSDFAAMVNKEV